MSDGHHIDMGFDGGHGGDELGDYLIQREKNSSGGPFGNFFSNVSTNVRKIIPKRIGGTGSIEQDIALRFGIGSASTNNNINDQTDSSGVGGWTPTLSRKERIIGFFVLLGMGVVFFILSGLYIPVLLFKARKFSIFFTLGSVFTFASLSVLWGFLSFIKHLFSPGRIVFTGMYFGSLFATLFFAVGLQSTILTVIGIIFQFIALLSFVVSYLPGGVAGLTYLGKFVTSSFSKTLPI